MEGCDKYWLYNIEEAAPQLKGEIASVEAKLRTQRTSRWTARMEGDIAYQRQWIKRADEQDKRDEIVSRPDAGISPQALHPVEIIRKAEKDWTAIWRAPHPADRHVQAEASPVVYVCAEGLLRCARQIKGKAGGADGHTLGPWLRLPTPWWEALLMLWNDVLASGDLPRRWVDARTALVNKEGGGHRPITITQVAWRLGMSCIMTQLTQWVDAWALAPMSGG